MPEGRTAAVVVVDHDGGEMTLACLRHLAATEWDGPLRVVLVDNASQRPLTAEQLASVGGPTAGLRPSGWSVEAVRSARNLGFAGGVNLGFAHLGVGSPGGPDLVALVNNDAFVAPGWLAPLVGALDGDPAVGAAAAKLLFEPVFAPVGVTAPLVAQRRGPALGVRVVAPPGSVFGAGFDAVRPGEWWTTAPEGTVYVPVAAGPEVRLGLAAAAPGSATVAGRTVAVRPGAPTEVAVRLPAAEVSVIQNAGNELTSALWVRDRGARQPDDARFDEPCDVWGWCGGAVLFPASYLADVGWMDDRFFLYWEDVDLSWRGARRGWRYRYVPTSVVRHRHGASMGALGPRFEALNQRNRLVVVARHAGLRAATRAWARVAAEAAWFAWRDGVVAVVGRRRPSGRRVTVRLRALGGAVSILARGRWARRGGRWRPGRGR